METNWSQIWESLVETPFGLYSLWEESLGAACGLPALTFHVLQTLAEAPEGRLRLQELADAVRHSQSGTTRLVDRLENEGLVARHLCEADRRVTWAVLSPGGRAVYDKALPAWNSFLTSHLQVALSADEAVQLKTLLGKLKATLGPGANTCPSQKAG